MNFHFLSRTTQRVFNLYKDNTIKTPFRTFSTSQKLSHPEKKEATSSTSTSSTAAAAAAAAAASAAMFASWVYSDNSSNPHPTQLDPYPRAPVANTGVSFPVPSRGKLIFVGDVHGCYNELQDLLAKVNFNPQEGDFLVLVGDLIGKGPDSLKVIQFAMKLGRHCAILRGNHEQVIVDWRWKIDHDPKASFTEMSDDVKTHRECAIAMNEEEWQYILRSPLWLHFPEINVMAVHAGLFPLLPMEKQNPRELMNIRSVLPKHPKSNNSENSTSTDEAHPQSHTGKSFDGQHVNLGDFSSLYHYCQDETGLHDLRMINTALKPSNKIDPKGTLWAETYSSLSILMRNAMEMRKKNAIVNSTSEEKCRLNDFTIDLSKFQLEKQECDLEGALHLFPHIIFGHDAKSHIQIHPNATGLDSGCCYGRSLTALVFENPGEKVAELKKKHNLAPNEAYAPIPLPSPSLRNADVEKHTSTHYLMPYFKQVPARQQYQAIGRVEKLILDAEKKLKGKDKEKPLKSNL